MAWVLAVELVEVLAVLPEVPVEDGDVEVEALLLSVEEVELAVDALVPEVLFLEVLGVIVPVVAGEAEVEVPEDFPEPEAQVVEPGWMVNWSE